MDLLCDLSRLILLLPSWIDRDLGPSIILGGPGGPNPIVFETQLSLMWAGAVYGTWLTCWWLIGKMRAKGPVPSPPRCVQEPAASIAS